MGPAAISHNFDTVFRYSFPESTVGSVGEYAVKFVPAFFCLGLFGAMAYMVWTSQYPFHLLPEDPGDPDRILRAEATMAKAVSVFGSFNTGLGLLMIGAISSVFFLMEKPEKPEI